MLFRDTRIVSKQLITTKGKLHLINKLHMYSNKNSRDASCLHKHVERLQILFRENRGIF